MTKKELASYIDHTLLAPQAGVNEIIQLCQEAKRYNFASVCVNPVYVSTVSTELRDSNIKTCTVVGFPLGAVTTKDKINESLNAIANGADEIDMVINIAALKNGDYDYIKKEIEEVRDSIGAKILKVIIETCLLTDEEIIKMTHICNDTFVNFIKTSTGFSDFGATVESINLIRENKNDVLEIKASGGINNMKTMQEMIDAGATRIGTSHAVDIMEDKGDE